MTSRQQQAAPILANPADYAVCEGCGSIVRVPVRRGCPACNAYQFDASADRVLAQAKLLSGREAGSVGE